MDCASRTNPYTILNSRSANRSSAQGRRPSDDSPVYNLSSLQLAAAMGRMAIAWTWEAAGSLAFTDQASNTRFIIRLIGRAGDAEPRVVVEPLKTREAYSRSIPMFAQSRAHVFTQACAGCRTVTEGAQALLRFFETFE